MDLQILNKLIQTLSEIGFTSNEANTYLVLLGIGPNPASVIAKKTAINRCTCYTVLEQLLKKGFVRKFIKSNVTYFSPIEPTFILDRLKNKHNELEVEISGLSSYITQLVIKKNELQGRPKVVFYEGADGIRNVMEDTLTSKTPIMTYSSLNELTKLLPGYLTGYSRTRTAKGITLKAIYPADRIGWLRKLRDNEALRESRLIPKKYDFHLHVLIYDNKVAITSLREKFGVLVESDDMSDALQKIFNFFWETVAGYDRLMTAMMERMHKKKQ
jgi:sugar-specific transcriptional regulator TrmB